MKLASEKIAVIGLGYVGLPVAIALARKFEDTVGFDLSGRRVSSLRGGVDYTGEIEGAELAASSLRITDNPDDIADCTFVIVTVPTPIDSSNRPDLAPLESACEIIGQRLSPGTVVVFESTVYPGVTEEVCGPLLARHSGLMQEADFFLGYSPERINPGDKTHRLETIVKIVSAASPDALKRVEAVYGSIIEAGLFVASSIKAAEAAKVIENAQRDINIAFINEITQIFGTIGLSVWDVLRAARTKWNFLPFEPGLVGGHCIGVDPFYLSHLAEQLGHNPQVILSGRTVNDGMAHWIAERIHRELGEHDRSILVLGLTFKEDVPDLRNSKVADLIKALASQGHRVTVHDPLIDPEQARHEYDLVPDETALERSYDCVIGAVAHRAYKALSNDRLEAITQEGGLVVDLKNMWRHLANGSPGLSAGRRYWSM